MINDVNRVFFNLVKNFRSEEYITAMILYNIAPTLCGCKPSSLVSFCKNSSGMYEYWKEYGDIFVKNLSLTCYELKKSDNSITVLFYDRKKLEKVIKIDKNLRLLSSLGYDENGDFDEIITELKNRFRTGCPHEIGVFLGIPVDDVISFIQNCGEKYLLCGYWKVYHNEKEAMGIFKQYNDSKINILNYIVREIRPVDII